MTTTYEVALETIRKATVTFTAITSDYRSGKINDAEFLAAKAIYNAAEKEFDAVYIASQSDATEPTTRWIVYIDGTEICDCNSRREAYDQLQARAQRFPGTYELTENLFSEINGIGHLTQVAAEEVTF